MTNLTCTNTNGSLRESVKRTDVEYRAPEAVNARGLFELPRDGNVSSLALTPDGCYVFAGFGGGEVRMYAQALNTVGAASRSGTLVAQIRSKGMFSNTKVECCVEASEDGRFVFAGMLRGSSEMLALDINDLPRWSTLPATEEASMAATEYDLNRRIRTYAHSDGKLKGFGAAALVRTGSDRSRWGDEYRLFCGRGVKNIHVWSFKPAYAAAAENGSDKLGEESNGGTRAGSGDTKSGEWGAGGEWTCLYDTHTNGATVELVAFRNGGLEGITKSTDANVRVWDLSGDNNPAKPPFRDVSNSKDTRAVFGDYAYGGATALSLVKIDEPAAANRMEIGLPESGTNAQTGRPIVSSTRGKRHCRMLKDLAGTQDGRHVVMVCSDGTVLYHRHIREATMLKLQPLEGLGFKEDTRPTVALTLVGRYGLPVLMIAGERGRRNSAGLGGEEAGKRLELMALPVGSTGDLDGLQAMEVCKWYGDWAPLGPWPEGRRLSAKDELSSDEDEDDDDEEEDNNEGEEDGKSEVDDNREDERLGDGGKGSHVGRQAIPSRKHERFDIRGPPPTARELLHHERGRRKVSREGSRGDGIDGAGRKKVPEEVDVKADLEAPKASQRNLGGGSIEARRSHTGRPGHSKSVAGVGAANDHPDGVLGEKLVGVKTSPDSAPLPPLPGVSTLVPAWVEKPQLKDEHLERVNGRGSHSEDEVSDDDSIEADDDVGVGRRKEGFSGLGVTYITPVASPSVGSESALPAPVHGSNWSSGSTSRKRAPRGGDEFPREFYGRASIGDTQASMRSAKEDDHVAEGSGSRNVERHTTPACLTSHGLNIAAVANLRSNGSEASLGDFSTPKPRGSAEKSALGDLAAAAAAALAAATCGNLSESEDAAEEGGGKDGEVSGVVDEMESSLRSRDGPTRLYYGREKRDGIVKRDLFHPSPQPTETAEGSRFLGNSAKNDYPPLADNGTPIKPSSLLEDVHEKANKRANGAGVGGESGPGGRDVASAKRIGRKRIRDDWERLSTGDDEGDKVESIRSLKARRGGSHTRPDEVGAAGEKGNTSTGASADGQQPDRFPPRDRRARIAARVLRSSGSAFDFGVLTKGVGAGRAAWAGDGQQHVERLSVVRISESDVGVVPAPVPAALASFLEMRRERRRREMTPVSLEQARARHGSYTALPPGRVPPFGGGTAVAETGRLDREANPQLDEQTAPEATGDSGVESSLPKSLTKSAPGGSEGSALPGSAGCVGRIPNGKEESSSRRTDDDVGNNSQLEVSTAGPFTVAATNGVVLSSSEDVGKDRDLSRDAVSRQLPDTPGRVTTCVASPVALVSKEQDCRNAAAPPSITEEVVQQASVTSKGLAFEGSTGKSISVLSSSKRPEGDVMEKGGEEEQGLEGGPEVFPPPMEAVIEMRERSGDRGSGGGATDRLYSAHCLEREAVVRVFFEEQDRLRRRFQSAVDVLELDNAVESAGLGLRSGCRTVQTLKMRLKSCWKEGCRGNEVHRCKSKEAHQATQRFQEQMRHVIRDHKELLREVLGRQRLEANALQMSQEMEVTRGGAPLLQVRSAFPGMFEEVARRHHIFL